MRMVERFRKRFGETFFFPFVLLFFFLQRLQVTNPKWQVMALQHERQATCFPVVRIFLSPAFFPKSQNLTRDPADTSR